MTANAGPRLFDSDFQYDIRPLRYQKTCQKKKLHCCRGVPGFFEETNSTSVPNSAAFKLHFCWCLGTYTPGKICWQGWKNTPEELMKAPRVQPFIYYISNINLENIYNKSAPHNKKIVVIV